jgi:hypothetical protein
MAEGKTVVSLFVDGSRESQEARQILRDRCIAFDVVPSTGTNLPAATYQSGVFRGVQAIHELVAALKPEE